jgi:hypothetical protein
MNNFLSEVIDRLLGQVFSPRPQISRRGSVVVLQSCWRTSLLTLGARKRRVELDPVRRIVKIYDRRWWVAVSSQVIPFDRIKEVVFACLNTNSTSWTAGAGESYVLGLTVPPQRHTLFLFNLQGDGEFVNDGPWPDWMYAEEIAAGALVKNTRDDEARNVADVLARMTGCPLSNDFRD